MSLCTLLYKEEKPILIYVNKTFNFVPCVCPSNHEECVQGHTEVLIIDLDKDDNHMKIKRRHYTKYCQIGVV